MPAARGQTSEVRCQVSRCQYFSFSACRRFSVSGAASAASSCGGLRKDDPKREPFHQLGKHRAGFFSAMGADILKPAMKRPLLIALAGAALIFAAFLARQRMLRGSEREREFASTVQDIERAEAAEAAVPAVPVSLDGGGRYYLNSVFVWNGRVVASMSTQYPRRDEAQRYWVYDRERDAFMPHPQRHELLWLIGGKRAIAVVRSNGAFDLVEFRGASRRVLKRDFVVPQHCAITFNDTFVFVLTPGAVEAIDSAGHAVMSKIEEPEVTTAEASPEQLLVSCDQGEFGGSLAAYTIARDGRIGSRKDLGKAHLTSSEQDEQNNIWMWGTFRHLMLGSSELYVYPPGGPLRNLRSEHKVDVPDAVTIESPGHVLVLTGSKGISRVDARGNVEELWHGRTSIVLQTERIGQVFNRDKDTPHSMAVLGDRLFVASQSLGVYEFEHTATGVRFVRQLQLTPDPAVVPADAK
jgi:hypothetical protein